MTEIICAARVVPTRATLAAKIGRSMENRVEGALVERLKAITFPGCISPSSEDNARAGRAQFQPKPAVEQYLAPMLRKSDESGRV